MAALTGEEKPIKTTGEEETRPWLKPVCEFCISSISFTFIRLIANEISQQQGKGLGQG